MKRRCSSGLDCLASQITDSTKWRRLNGWAVVVWAVVLPVAIISGAIYVLAFTAILSVYANWATHLGAWAAARAESKQDDLLAPQE